MFQVISRLSRRNLSFRADDMLQPPFPRRFVLVVDSWCSPILSSQLSVSQNFSQLPDDVNYSNSSQQNRPFDLNNPREVALLPLLHLIPRFKHESRNIFSCLPQPKSLDIKSTQNCRSRNLCVIVKYCLYQYSQHLASNYHFTNHLCADIVLYQYRSNSY